MSINFLLKTTIVALSFCSTYTIASQGSTNGRPFQELQAQITANQELIDANSEQITEVSTQVADLQYELTETQALLEGLAVRVEDNEVSIDAISLRVSANEEDVDALYQGLSDTMATTNQLRIDLTNEIQTVDSRLGSLITGNTNLITELNRLVGELQALSSDNNTDISDLYIQVTALLSTTMSNTNSINILTRARDDIFDEIHILDVALDNLESQVDIVKSRIENLESFHKYVETFTGILSTSDPISLTRSTYADYYTFTIGYDSFVNIDLGSTTLNSNGQYGSAGFFDTYIYLHNGSDTSSFIYFNDDGGEGLNSKLRVHLSAGTYTVQVTSWASFATGNYQLRIEQD